MLDVRYEYIRQNQPRAGSEDVAVGEIHRHHDEVSTVNRNTLLTYAHTFNSTWGVALTAPFLDREHDHIHNHQGEQIADRWDFREVGDVRLVGRYQLPGLGNPLQPGTTGITFGLKLPTGKTTIANADGDLAERTLQPGTGTTDVIVGAFHHQKFLKSGSAWFVQAQYQQAVKSHADYKPGNQFAVDVGYRHGLSEKVGAMIQLNGLTKRSDSGAEAEPEDSGSRSVFLSPGLSYAVSHAFQVYAFYQKPVYQHVTGVQLTANEALVVGMSGRF